MNKMQEKSIVIEKLTQFYRLFLRDIYSSPTKFYAE